jgi:hypothetical protein
MDPAGKLAIGSKIATELGAAHCLVLCPAHRPLPSGAVRGEHATCRSFVTFSIMYFIYFVCRRYGTDPAGKLAIGSKIATEPNHSFVHSIIHQACIYFLDV